MGRRRTPLAPAGKLAARLMPQRERENTDLCTCGHEYGQHEQRRPHPCAIALQARADDTRPACGCMRFMLAPGIGGHVPSFHGEPMSGALRRAQAEAADRRLTGERLARALAIAPPGTPEHTAKGDSLLLLRIAVALERIADAGERTNEIAAGMEKRRSADYLTTKGGR
jgi:hypothetical protein